MKRKILYLMHVDWGWIKQRPHFLAERFSEFFDVNVFYAYSRNRKDMTNNPTSISTVPIISLPFKKINLIRHVNTVMQKFIFFIVLKVLNPDIIWITHPTLHDYLPRKQLSKYMVIYDCMDDVLGFNNTPEAKQVLDQSEKRLFKDSEIVFVSSENLQNQIIKRGCPKENTYLVRNGYNGEIVEPAHLIKNDKGKFTLCYIGTISNWVNFDIILKSLERFDDIEYHFLGPIETDVPKHERIIFHGPVKHSELYETIKAYDCLIMPFKINDLILSVDPVKLYEYVNFNKNIITVYYDEIQRFAEFVYFYNEDSEYFQAIELLKENNTLKYNEDQRYEFLINNTWNKRTERILDVLQCR